MSKSAINTTTCTGWGRYPKAPCGLYRPDSLRELGDIPADCKQRGWSVIPRGLGRSYGDAALNGGFGAALMTHLDRMIEFNASTGRLRCEAGLSLLQIIRRLMPLGWFPMVTPGTQFCTVGGAIAADVHGKNHHVDGSFGDHLYQFTLMLPSSEMVCCSREQNSDLFWATIGGMGLTGVIVDAEFQLRAVQTSRIVESRVRTRDLEETLFTFQERDSMYPYSVAWMDCLSTGRGFGRGVLLFGDHAVCTDLPKESQSAPLKAVPKKPISVPCDTPGFLLNRVSLMAFNDFYYSGHPTRPSLLAGAEIFFHPLDQILNWNRLYGKSGFVQWQCIVPFKDGSKQIQQILEKVQHSGQLPFLCILKRMGKSSGGLLSFPMEGYTLAMDFPVRKGLLPLLDALDELVLQAGGRLYLAKDARASASTIAAMYPQLNLFKTLKMSVDPDVLIQSNMSRRLELSAEVSA